MAQQAQQPISNLIVFPELPEVLKTYPYFDFNEGHYDVMAALVETLQTAESRPEEEFNKWKNLSQKEKMWIQNTLPDQLNTTQGIIGQAGLWGTAECTRYINMWRVTGSQAQVAYDILYLGRQVCDAKRKASLNKEGSQRKVYANLFLGIISKINEYRERHYSFWVEAIMLDPAAAEYYKGHVKFAISRLDSRSNRWKDQLTSMFNTAPFGNDNGAQTIRNAFYEERTRGTVAGIKGTPTEYLVTNLSSLGNMHGRMTEEHEKLDARILAKISPLLSA